MAEKRQRCAQHREAVRWRPGPDAERVIADWLAAGFGAGHGLAARLAAAALVAGLRVAEETAAAQMQDEDRALTPAEVTALLDSAVAFAEAGIARLA